MNAMVTLIRREFWEHRYLWIVPAVIAGIMLAIAIGGSALATHGDLRIEIGAHPASVLGALSPSRHEHLFALQLAYFWGMQLVIMLIVISFYALDCLYAERRDRSILFWKSMPVSDGQTVLAKFLAASAATPLLVYAVALVTGPLCLAILHLRLAGTPAADYAYWDTGVWLRMQAILLGDTLVAAIWYAPLLAASMLVSAWVRRNPFMWASLGSIMIWFVERELFGTHYFWDLLSYRTVGFFTGIGLHRGPVGIEDAVAAYRFDASQFLSPDLWLGAAAAAAMLYAAARIRRYRDDT